MPLLFHLIGRQASLHWGAAGENLMPQAIRSADQKLPLSTAILSNIALLLLMWNLALRLALLLGRWATP
ncbi:MAG: hypothetical protein WB678_08000 [Stellaceae bacterium]